MTPREKKIIMTLGDRRYFLCYLLTSLFLLLSVGLPVANAPDVLQPCGLLYYP